VRQLSLLSLKAQDSWAKVIAPSHLRICSRDLGASTRGLPPCQL